jgi:hypothetical protein
MDPWWVRVYPVVVGSGGGWSSVARARLGLFLLFVARGDGGEKRSSKEKKKKKEEGVGRNKKGTREDRKSERKRKGRCEWGGVERK